MPAQAGAENQEGQREGQDQVEQPEDHAVTDQAGQGRQTSEEDGPQLGEIGQDRGLPLLQHVPIDFDANPQNGCPAQDRDQAHQSAQGQLAKQVRFLTVEGGGTLEIDPHVYSVAESPASANLRHWEGDSPGCSQAPTGVT